MRVTARARGLHVLNASTKYDLDAVPSRIGGFADGSNGDLLQKCIHGRRRETLVIRQNATMCQLSRSTRGLR